STRGLRANDTTAFSRSPQCFQEPNFRPWSNRWSLNNSSLRLDARELDHPRPFLGLVANEFSKISGRARNYHAAQVHKPRLERRIGQAGIDLFVKLANDCFRGVSRRADAVPGARFIARNEFGKRWNIGERRRTCRCGDGQSPQLA